MPLQNVMNHLPSLTINHGNGGSKCRLTPGDPWPPEIPRFSSPPTMEFWMVPAAAGPPWFWQVG